jgi:DNA-binding transcriptional LysR family regulator
MEQYMINLNELAIFVEVVDSGNFTSAARRLGLPKSNVSRKIALLESRLETRLLHRNTRSMSLTEAGRRYYEHCSLVVNNAREAEKVISGLQLDPSGTLRISAPTMVGVYVMPQLVSQFLSDHPNLNIELILTDGAVNLLHQNLDLALFSGPAASSTYISRPLGRALRVICASRGYVESHGEPSHPDDLQNHNLLEYTSWNNHRWRMRRGGVEKKVDIIARYAANDVSTIQSCMLTGLGVAMLPEGPIKHLIDAGKVVRILPDWQLKSDDIRLYYPSRTHLPSKVRAFIDFLMDPIRELPGLKRY